jgi:hypothetical protein
MAGVIRTEGHPRHVQKAFGDIASLDEVLGGFLDGHVDGGRIAHCSHDQVGFGLDPFLVGFVAVDEDTPRRLDNPYTFFQTTSRSPEAPNILKKIKIEALPEVLQVE